MSRARLGLYVFCRRSIFENCYELAPTFNKLLERPDKLQLKINEMWPATRMVYFILPNIVLIFYSYN